MGKLFGGLHREGVEYVLVGGQAVRLNGFVRATEDVDVLLANTRENGERAICALSFLRSANEIDPAWFERSVTGEVENIRVADDLLVDLLFSANGQTYDSLKAHIRTIDLDGTPVRVLDIPGLLKTKTSFRKKDQLDRSVLMEIQQQLEAGERDV